jgi:hypothetical protein
LADSPRLPHAAVAPLRTRGASPVAPMEPAGRAARSKQPFGLRHAGRGVAGQHTTQAQAAGTRIHQPAMPRHPSLCIDETEMCYSTRSFGRQKIPHRIDGVPFRCTSTTRHPSPRNPPTSPLSYATPHRYGSHPTPPISLVTENALRPVKVHLNWPNPLQLLSGHVLLLSGLPL